MHAGFLVVKPEGKRPFGSDKRRYYDVKIAFHSTTIKLASHLNGKFLQFPSLPKISTDNPSTDAFI